MIVEFFKHGTGKAEGAINYLMGSKDHAGKERDVKPEVFKGNIKETKGLIDGINRKFKYASGVIAFRDSEKPTKEELKKVINSFEKSVTGGMQDRVNFLWILHQDKGNIELHFLVPMKDLITGKQVNINPPGSKSQQLMRDFQAMWNDELGYDQVVEDPLKAQISFLDAKVPKENSNRTVKNRFSEIAAKEIRAGKINNRGELVQFLKAKGIKVVTTSQYGKTLKTCIKIERVMTDKAGIKSTQLITLKGPLFHENANYREIVKVADEALKNKKLTQEERLEIVTRLRDGVNYRHEFNTRMLKPTKQKAIFWKKTATAKTNTNTQKIGNTNKIGASNNDLLNKNDNTQGNVQSKEIKPLLPSKQKQSKGSQNTATSSNSGASSGAGSIDKLNVNISNLQNEVLALGIQLSQVSPSKRAEIERKIYQLKMQIIKLQQQVIEMQKAQMNALKPK